MDEHDDLADGFEANRPHLRAVAYRMLGSVSEADDAVQEAWLRLNRSDTSAIENLGGWLTTVVARVSLDMLRSRTSRREQPAGHARAAADREPRGRRRPRAAGAARRLGRPGAARRARDAQPRPSGSRSCCTTCSPCRSTRSPRSSAAPRPPRGSSRAARAGACAVPCRRPTPTARASAQVVDAFLAAARDGDFDALLAVLDPDVVLRVDRGALASREIRGASAVVEQARMFARLARFARPARVNGSAGFVVHADWAARRRRLYDRRRADRRDRPPRRPARLRVLDLSALDDWPRLRERDRRGRRRASRACV